jgi:beta-N-acetylglucosaminidase
VAAAKKYSITASYIVAHAALESGWGSAKIAREKKNLFGWSAFDASPYSSATGFPVRETCVDFVMGRINELYLTPSGC